MKKSTLAVAVLAALGLSACGDSQNAANDNSQNISVTKKQSFSRPTEAEDKITSMMIMGDPETLKMMFELFPKTNTRMEKNKQNCFWYAGRGVIPAWSRKVSKEEIDKAGGRSNFIGKIKSRSSYLIPNENGEFDPRVMPLIKEVFFIEGVAFDKDRLKNDTYVRAFYCMLDPDNVGYRLDVNGTGEEEYFDVLSRQSMSDLNFYKGAIVYISEELIGKQKTKYVRQITDNSLPIILDYAPQKNDFLYKNYPEFLQANQIESYKRKEKK